MTDLIESPTDLGAMEGFSVAAYCVGEDLGRQANLLFLYSAVSISLWHSFEVVTSLDTD